MEHGTWNMEHGTWNMEHGTWNMEHGTIPLSSHSESSFYHSKNLRFLTEEFEE
jgi:hypothetical protein